MLNIGMKFAKEIGTTLAEEALALVVADELQLDEIRDLSTLGTYIKKAIEKNDHKKTKSYAKLHLRKATADVKKEKRQSNIKNRQEMHVQKHGYTRVGDSDTWKHPQGHTVSFDKDRKWTHNKAGGDGASPIRGLSQHLRSIHEDEVKPVNEIRRISSLGQRINALTLKHNDPIAKERLMRLQALKKRKFDLISGMQEGEGDERGDHTHRCPSHGHYTPKKTKGMGGQVTISHGCPSCDKERLSGKKLGVTANKDHFSKQ